MSLTPRALVQECAVGAVALLRPDRAPLVLGPLADSSTTTAAASALVYPADGSIATARSVALRSSGCHGQTARLRSLSLFGGAVTAAQVSLHAGRVSVSDLAVGGKHTNAAAGTRVPLARWGYVVVRPPMPIHVARGAAAAGGLALHLTAPHDGLPAGTVVLVTPVGEHASLPAKAHDRTHKRKHKPAQHAPLKVTPPLALAQYVFPVVGPSEYVDTYGAFRSDVPGNWHHGDDIFAPLGTPVVAVAPGTINRVGWNPVGGWRIWVRDSAGDEFYYAHLAGYVAHDMRTKRVQAGQVIGFVGNTGDAFTTSPHVHFEVHPRQLLRLGYDGAVDPTSYLGRWHHVARVKAPRPVHPPLPKQPTIRKEAVYVFRELLAARHLIKHAPKPSERPHVHIPPGANGFAPPVAAPPLAASSLRRTAHGLSTAEIALLAALGSVLAFGATVSFSGARQNLAAGLQRVRRRIPRS